MTKDHSLTLNKDKISGVFAWLTLVFGIVAYDIYAIKSSKIETLTRSFWRLTEKQLSGVILIGAWLVLTFHLLIEKSIRKKISKGKK